MIDLKKLQKTKVPIIVNEEFIYNLKDKGNQLITKDSLIRNYFISEFSQIIYPNWLYDIVNFQDPIVISQFIKPVDAQKALVGLRNRITNLMALYYEKTDKGKVNVAELEQSIKDAKSIEDLIIRGSEKLYYMSLYIQLKNEDNKLLQRSEQTLKDLAFAKQIKLYQLMFRQRGGLESILPKAEDTLNENLLLTSSNVSSSLPFTTSTLNDPDGIFYGVTINGSKVRFDRFSPTSKNYNGIIFATSGAGKSFAVKLEAYRSLFKGINVYVIDPEGEFKSLCDFVGGTNIDINPESKTKVNPLQFFSNNFDSKEVMRRHLGVVKGLLKIWLSNKAYDRGIVSKAVNDTYVAKGINLDDVSTYYRKPPVISDLIEVFQQQGSIGKRIAVELLEYSKQGELGDLYDNLTTDDVNFDSPMVVFNIQKVPEQEKQATIYFLSNFIWQRVLADRKEKLLIIDEAHLLLKEESSGQFIEDLVRRGRKYNLGVICISQDVDDFLENSHGNVIAKNAETALILSQKKQSIPSLSRAFNLSVLEEEYLTSLTKGQSLFIKGNNHSYLYIYATPHERGLFSSNPEDLAKLDNLRK